MLAHSGLALITEKLQNQRLEESSPATCCSKLPQVTQDSSVKSVSQQQPNLTVQGKNVWALSLESERQGRYDFANQDIAKSIPRPLEDIQTFTLSVCQHKKPRYSCQLCDSAPGTPIPPPKKKHCRSLSVPPDNLIAFQAPTRDQGGKIWKPIAVIPQSNNNVQDNKDRNLLPVIHTGESTKWLPKFSSGFRLVPVVPSPPSIDSGHYTTSDFQTPSGSPVPRPASAASDTSFSSLGSAWHDYSPLKSRTRVLENRSLSCEDRISGSSSSNSISCFHGSAEHSSQCCGSNSQDGSNVCGSGGIPRCHSQPCVLHHRRCGKKRRRDCDRPTLNFIKMTETAYTRSHRRSEPWNTSVADHQLQVPLYQMFPDNVRFGLNPIASSPLDSELPIIAQHFLDINTTRGGPAGPSARPHCRTPSDFPDPEKRQEEHEGEDEEEEEEDCDCHDNQTDDRVGFFPVSDLDLEQIENH
ncbi:unnamed protein product [Candidula unifasciata]|uniref:Uncharacterized protein n=1 Tax=Candidula unifasciata TaxID=100452 RepID=A0A8S3YUJ5_9EUPU|nr:unnamed protein product [Candidula unifasciata]